mmetsp:Transcript_94121/g.269792  ORF Transcript_94121/g.269792 Transcript_94121/m.269792 type:complete len:236 (-) Transcript_94121:119-826(-)
MAFCACGSARDCGWVLDEDAPRWPTVCMFRRQVLRSPETTAFPGVLSDEQRHGPILLGSLVCVRTGWAKRYLAGRAAIAERRRLSSAAAPGSAGAGDDAVLQAWTEYHNAGEVGDIHPDYKLPRMHFPGLSAAAAAFLVKERSAVGIGVDTLSPDPGASEGFRVHHAVLGADRYIIENLNLEGLPARGARVTVAPLNVAGAPEAPARVFALVPAPTPTGAAQASSRGRGRSVCGL